MPRRKESGLAERMASGYYTPTEEAGPDASQTAGQEGVGDAKKSGTKRTFYLDNEVIAHLRLVQMERFKQTGKQPLLSDLVEEAIRLLPEARQAN